jgi:hypothetical protein
MGALGVEIVQAIIWSCRALSVVLADVAIHWKEILSALTVPARSGVFQHLSQLYEGAHDRDVGPDGPFAIEDTRQHCDALRSESLGQITPAAAACL